MRGATAYDAIAGEYYESTHVTSRNFDAASRKPLEAIAAALPRTGSIIELGAGRGRAGEYLGVSPGRVIQCDASEKMLSLTCREECVAKALCDANETPFMPRCFAIAAAFLFDAFNDVGFYREVHRILKPGGVFVGTLPTCEWGWPLRDLINIPRDTTRFFTRDDEVVQAPSLLRPLEEVAGMASSVGLRVAEWEYHTLASETARLSPDIEKSAIASGQSTAELPLVATIVANKPS